jgi:hypothetical protein
MSIYALILVGGILMVVLSIYLSGMIDCSAWCCVTTRTDDIRMHSTLKYEPHESKVTLQQFSRDKNGTESGSSNALMIMENMYSGIATLFIPHNPLYEISRKAAEVTTSSDGKVFTPVHKHNFPMVTMCGKKGTPDDIYATVFMSQTMARPGAVLVMNGVDSPESPAFSALNKLVNNGVVEWDEADLFINGNERWISAKMKAVDTSKSVSEYLYDVIYKYLQLKSSPTVYYVTSREREDELRIAYKNDKQFRVTNITTVIHGMILKVLFPAIELVIVENSADLLYERGLVFLRTHIMARRES